MMNNTHNQHASDTTPVDVHALLDQTEQKLDHHLRACNDSPLLKNIVGGLCWAVALALLAPAVTAALVVSWPLGVLITAVALWQATKLFNWHQKITAFCVKKYQQWTSLLSNQQKEYLEASDILLNQIRDLDTQPCSLTFSLHSEYSENIQRNFHETLRSFKERLETFLSKNHKHFDTKLHEQSLRFLSVLRALMLKQDLPLEARTLDNNSALTVQINWPAQNDASASVVPQILCDRRAITSLPEAQTLFRLHVLRHALLPLSRTKWFHRLKPAHREAISEALSLANQATTQSPLDVCVRKELHRMADLLHHAPSFSEPRLRSQLQQLHEQTHPQALALPMRCCVLLASMQHLSLQARGTQGSWSAPLADFQQQLLRATQDIDAEPDLKLWQRLFKQAADCFATTNNDAPNAIIVMHTSLVAALFRWADQTDHFLPVRVMAFLALPVDHFTTVELEHHKRTLKSLVAACSTHWVNEPSQPEQASWTPLKTQLISRLLAQTDCQHALESHMLAHSSARVTRFDKTLGWLYTAGTGLGKLFKKKKQAPTQTTEQAISPPATRSFDPNFVAQCLALHALVHAPDHHVPEPGNESVPFPTAMCCSVYSKQRPDRPDVFPVLFAPKKPDEAPSVLEASASDPRLPPATC